MFEQFPDDIAVYKVGGAVRDRLLNLSVKDIDWVVVGAQPDYFLEHGYQQVGKDFPVFLHPKTHQEFALARKERKVAPGYTGFEFDTSQNVTLEEDLLRRDITINAMAEDQDGQIIDPFNGQADLKLGILRHVSAAFSEDPVRILRVARFAARFGFKLADETLNLMKQMVANGEVESLVAERVWQELERALGEKDPQLFFQVLRSSDALAVIFPEIDRLYGVPQTEKYHPEIDTGIHTMLALQQAVKLSEDKKVRFAVLLHDLGKGVTPKELLPSHHGHEQASADLIKTFCARFKVPKEYRDLALIVGLYHTDCHRINDLKATTILKKLEKMDAFRRQERFDQFLLACEADARGRKGLEQQAYPQAANFRAAQRAAASVTVRTLDIEGLQGEQIAQLLREQRLIQIKQVAKDF